MNISKERKSDSIAQVDETPLKSEDIYAPQKIDLTIEMLMQEMMKLHQKLQSR